MKDGQQHLANLSSAPSSVLQVPGCQQPLPGLFSPGKSPQPVSSHQDTVAEHHAWALLQVFSSAGTQKSCMQVQGSTSPRCKRLPQRPHYTQVLKNPKQDCQNGCEMMMFLAWKLSSSPTRASPRTFFSAALLYLQEVGKG